MKLNSILFLLLTVPIVRVPAQTTVSSLAELSTYLGQDSVHVKLAPGTYAITTVDADSFGFVETVGEGTLHTLFPVTGNHNTFDFTGAKITFETGLLSAYGNIDVYHLRISGNGNTLTGLTMEDLGTGIPRKSAVAIAMDGKNNVIDGFHVTPRGSLPYAYGDIFGKGGNNATTLRKHSGILIRGDYNTLKNTTLIHRAYGHGVFMQAANTPTIENCYIEGEMRKTDDILAEEGTGTTADNLDFETIWGYPLPAGFMISLMEDGLRTYNRGTTVIDGVSIERGTNDVTVKNTTVKNTRSGAAFSLASGFRHLENVTLIGNEVGFNVGSGTIINGRADAAYGPAVLGEGATGDVTIIAPEDGYYSGTKSLVSQSGGTLTIYTEEPNIPNDFVIDMGTYRSFRHQEGSILLYQVDSVFSGATLYNHTSTPVILGPGASNSDVYTCGKVTDNGTNNTIYTLTECAVVPVCSNTVDNLQAECYDAMSGIDTEPCDEGGENIGWVHDGDWIAFSGLDLNGMKSIKARVSSKTTGNTLEVRTGSETGTLLAILSISNTGGFQNWATDSVNLDLTAGTEDVYFVFKGGAGYLFNVNYLEFSDKIIPENPVHAIPMLNSRPLSVKNTVPLLKFDLIGRLLHK